MARFAVHLGIRPWEYYQLTVAEREAIVAEWNRAKRKR